MSDVLNRDSEPFTSCHDRAQRRVRGDAAREKILRYLNSIEIDLDDGEVEISSTYPDESSPHGTGNMVLSRTIDLEDEQHSGLREAVKRLVEACQDAILGPDEDYDPERCDRCVNADCCRIDRIHLSEDERRRILDFLGEEDSRASYDRYFVEDEDTGGYYRTMFRHENGGCIFLKELNGMSRCSIYPARPQVCRDYDAGYCDEWTKLLPRS